MMKNLLKTILPLALTILFLYLALKELDFAAFLDSLQKTDPLLVVACAGMAVLSMVIRTWRWQMILAPVKRTAFFPVFNANMIGFMVNNILPARVGEVVRPYVLSRRGGINFSSSCATVVIERIFDGFALIIMLSALLLTLPVPPLMLYSGMMITAICFALAVLLGLLAADKYGMRRGLDRLLQRLPKRFHKVAAEKAALFLEGLNVLTNWRAILKLIAMSLLVWLHMASIIFMILMLFPYTSEQPVNEALASVAVIVLLASAVALPSTPGYVGVTQFAFKIALGIFTIGAHDAIATSLIYHITQYIPITVIGLLLMLRDGLSFKSLSLGESNPDVSLR